MCEADDVPVIAGADTSTSRLTRRRFVGLFGGLSAGLLSGAGVVVGAGSRPATAAQAQSFTGQRSLRAAMHVHGSFSEGTAAWSRQADQAARLGMDVLYMTDHDDRVLGSDLATSLDLLPLKKTTTGTLIQDVATVTAGSLRLTAESATSSPATSTMTADPAEARDRLRRSISGHQVTLTFSSCRLSNGAWLEYVISLSRHATLGSRSPGVYQLRYRFRGGTHARYAREGGGYVGVVNVPTPASGSSVMLDVTRDVAAIWPEMLAIDNSVHGMSWVARSPRQRAVVDVNVSMSISRLRCDEGSAVEDQRLIADAYQAVHPGLTIVPSGEVGNQDQPTHFNTFGTPQFFRRLVGTDAERFATLSSYVRSRGGVVCWNHPFGYQTGPHEADVAAHRHQVLQYMLEQQIAPDVVEIGYNMRGHATLADHLALFDTLSRRGTFVTGNGVNDDHGANISWNQLKNGFLTGLWAASVSDTDMASALRAGRAYIAHAGGWPNGAIDLLVDGQVPMGGVSVTNSSTRALAISCTSPPTGGSVSIVQGQIDYTGTDPLTATVATHGAGAFAAGPVTTVLDTSSSSFARAEVRNSRGVVVGGSNPVYLLREEPPGGIPVARRY